MFQISYLSFNSREFDWRKRKRYRIILKIYCLVDSNVRQDASVSQESDDTTRRTNYSHSAQQTDSTYHATVSVVPNVTNFTNNRGNSILFSFVFFVLLHTDGRILVLFLLVLAAVWSFGNNYSSNVVFQLLWFLFFIQNPQGYFVKIREPKSNDIRTRSARTRKFQPRRNSRGNFIYPNTRSFISSLSSFHNQSAG